MSAPPVRRLKDRAGTGVKVAAVTNRPSKSLTPSSLKKNPIEPALKRSSSGKENPRSTSATRVPVATQKPAIRQTAARIDKTSASAAINGESRVRRSTSSVPRGRSSSPSDCIRVFNDLRKERDSRVSGEKGSAGKSVGSEVRGLGSSNLRSSGSRGLGEIGIRAFRDGKENVKVGVNLSLKNESSKELKLGTGGSGKKLNSRLPGSSAVGVHGDVRRSCDKSMPGLDVKAQGVAVAVEESKEGFCSVLKSDDGVVKVSGGSKFKETCEETAGSHGNKYPSRLHEKLAFLEGKVKRIASDIKRTKEMLDMNNPDASKVILSDIQEKISGIEKVVGNVVGDSDGVKSLKSAVDGDQESQKTQVKERENVTNSVKGLNSEELEARFFPHHKLLRNRTSSKVSLGSTSIHEPLVLESSCELRIEDEPRAPADPLEFTSFLDKKQNEVTMRNGHGDIVFSEVQEVDSAAATSSTTQECSNVVGGRDAAELFLTADETLDEFDDQENKPLIITCEEVEDACIHQLNEIGCKNSTGGWFVSEGEAVLLAHDDSSCSFYDIANCEEKTEYKPPAGVSPNLWRDCWIIRAPSADGCSGRYVVAASAGNTMDSGFCSWDFYTKDVQAFHIEDVNGPTTSRTVLGPLPNNMGLRRNVLSNILAPEAQQWWYKPSGPLIVSTASGQRNVRIYDIRDGEHIMKWDSQKPVSSMDYSSPLQWRSRGKVVIAEAETISLWDVNSLTPQPLLSVPLSGRKISALHVNNTDAEMGGGVRQRVSSSEAEGHDGVFCTPDSINVFDFRLPTGVGLKMPKIGGSVHSVFSRGDSIFLGCSSVKSAGKKQSCSQVQQFSLRNQKLFSTYTLPESNAHINYTAITQVWGNSNLVMGVCGLGLFVFDTLKDDGLQPFTADSGCSQKIKEVIGPDDLYSPSFDYLGSRALLISGDRPAMWKYLS